MSGDKIRYVGTEWYPRTEGTVSLLIESNGTRGLVDVPPNITHLLDDMELVPGDIDSVLITHSHIDHIIGAPYLLMAYFFEKTGTIAGGPDKVGDIDIKVEESARENLDQLLSGAGVELEAFLQDQYSIEEVGPGDTFEIGAVDVELIRADHSVPTLGAVFSGDRRIGYTCDTVYSKQMVEEMGAVDVLIAEAALPSSQEELASQLKHATFTEAGQMASAVGADELYLVHISDLIADESSVISEAQKEFNGTVHVPEAYDTIELG